MVAPEPVARVAVTCGAAPDADAQIACHELFWRWVGYRLINEGAWDIMTLLNHPLLQVVS